MSQVDQQTSSHSLDITLFKPPHELPLYTKFILTDPIISPISCIYPIILSLISLLDLQKEAAKDPEEKAVSEDNPNKSPAQQDNSTTVLTTAEKENELQEDKDPGMYLE